MRPPLEDRFLRRLRRLGPGESPAHLLVAVSGGCDSMVLLHLLRFAARPFPLTLTVAHLDHALRPESAGDAAWLAGVCAAWEVGLVRERLERAPRAEEEARRARYAFLRREARRAGADWIVTAHHADDQAETVLFRALRGTGLAGLGGIRARTRSRLLRPLLPFWRDELEAYARRHSLRWRADTTNLDPGPARNRIRLHLLPEVERAVAPGARRSLVALAALARESEAGWARLIAPLESRAVRAEGGALVLARAALRGYDPAVGSRILRNSLRRFGVVLSRTGTRTALQFITLAPSGREMQLPRGVRVRLEFEEARIERAGEPPVERPLEIPAASAGEGAVEVGGTAYRAAWRPGGAGEPSATPGEWRVVLPLDALRFPLRLRGWSPGDRVRTPAGSKTLKKLFLERRVPRSRRARLPVLVDAVGAVLWVGGLDRGPATLPSPGERTLVLTLTQ